MRTDETILPDGLIHHQKELAKKKRSNGVLLDDFKSGVVEKMNLELKLDEKNLPSDLKVFHKRLIDKHKFEPYEKRQMREARRLLKLKRRLGKITLGRRRKGGNTGSSSLMMGNFSRNSRSKSTINNTFGNNPSKDSFQSDSSSIHGAIDSKKST